MATTSNNFSRKRGHKKQEAKRRGITFTLSMAKFKELKTSKKCFYTGAVLTDDNRSIDRIEATIGYTESNTVACTTHINFKKANLTLDDFKLIFNSLVDNDIIEKPYIKILGFKVRTKLIRYWT